MHLYILRCDDSGLGRYNAHFVYTRYVIADSEESAISLVLNSHTHSVEVLSVHDFISMPRGY